MVTVYGWEDAPSALTKRDVPDESMFSGKGELANAEYGIEGRWFLSLTAAKAAAVEELRAEVARIREEIARVRGVRKGDVG